MSRGSCCRAAVPVCWTRRIDGGAGCRFVCLYLVPSSRGGADCVSCGAGRRGTYRLSHSRVPTVSHPTVIHLTVSRPTATRPAAIRPSATGPSTTGPAASRPSVIRPPPNRQPPDRQPSDRQPPDRHPTGSHPTISHPTDSYPTVSHPTGSHPTATRPSVTQPGSTQPSGTCRTLTRAAFRNRASSTSLLFRGHSYLTITVITDEQIADCRIEIYWLLNGSNDGTTIVRS